MPDFYSRIATQLLCHLGQVTLGPCFLTLDLHFFSVVKWKEGNIPNVLLFYTVDDVECLISVIPALSVPISMRVNVRS